MSDFDYAFVTQLEEMKNDIRELMWEETQGSLDRMSDFFRFQSRWFEDIQNPFFGHETHQLIDREMERLREHQP